MAKKKEEPPKPLTLICAECSHENEPERVFCHSCGVKLDRTVLPQPEEREALATASLEATKKRVDRLMDPHRGRMLQNIKTFCMMIPASALLAAGFLLVMTPDDYPPKKSEDLPDQDAVEVWRGAMDARTPVRVQLREVEINRHLQRILKPVDTSIPGVKFERAYVKLEPNLITLTVERSVGGILHFTNLGYKPLVKDGHFDPNLVFMRFNRLGVDPAQAPKLMDLAAGLLKTTLAKEIKELDRIAEIQVAAGIIGFATKPAP